jgi:PPM family protein phosphatase
MLSSAEALNGARSGVCATTTYIQARRSVEDAGWITGARIIAYASYCLSDIEGARVETQDEDKRETVEVSDDAAQAGTGAGKATGKLATVTPEFGGADMESAVEHDAPIEPPAEEPAPIPQETPFTFAPGALVGSCRIISILRDTPGRRLALATTPIESDALYFVAEVPSDRATTISRLIDLQLRHPRLIAPRELISQGDTRFVVSEGSTVGSVALCDPAAGALPLLPEEALRAGAGLADTLSYLHRNGVAHQRVAPETILFASGRAYLERLDDATLLEDNVSEAPRFVARDANMLATTLAQLARVSQTPAPNESLAIRTLREVAAHGAEEGYSSPEEVAAACGSALQAPPHSLPTPPPETVGVPLHLEAGTATSVGLVRSENQDAVVSLVLDAHDDAARGDAPIGVFLVADGMGGEAHGELASRIAARILPSQLLSQLILPLFAKPALAFDKPITGENMLSIASVADMLDRAVTSANQHVREMAHAFGQDTGSTLTVVVCAGPQAALAHLGDSRLYLLRDGILVRLTEDHTLLARLEAMDHPILEDPTFYVPRNFLYRSLGQEQAPPDLRPFTLAPEDRFVICSDGLWDELDDEAIKSTLATADDPEVCARRLVEMANEAGGHDNSTAVVVFARARSVDVGAHGIDDTSEFPAIAGADPSATPAADSLAD